MMRFVNYTASGRNEMLLKMYDFLSTDFSKTHPDIKPGIGSVRFFTWAQFNPGRGVFNTQIIEDWLAKESLIKLQDGSHKPLMTFLFCHGAPKGDNGADHSPEWVRQICPTKTITVGTSSC